MFDGGWRVAHVEARDRPAVDLSAKVERRIGTLHREGLLVIVHEHDLARARRDAERRGGEGAEHVHDHGVAGRAAGAIEVPRDADVHRTAPIRGRWP